METARRIVLIVLLALPLVALAQGHTVTEAYAGRLVAAAVAQTRSSVTYDGSVSDDSLSRW